MTTDNHTAREEADARWVACGAEEDWPDLNPWGIATCDRAKGHDGEHRDNYSGVWWPLS
jgi:hypothetical protein